jgi:PAS domain S-box-containing protein
MTLTLALLAVLVLAFSCLGWFVRALLKERRGHHAAVAHAERLGRFYSALSQTNRLVLQNQGEASLFEETCRVCVETGHALLACVYIRHEHFAHRVASAGPAAKVLERVPNPWNIASPEAQRTHTVRAMREGVLQVSNDYQNDPAAGAWGQEARAQGIFAIAWVPIWRSGAPIGVLMLCADERDFFDEALVGLLTELGHDISFALDNIDRAAERLAAVREIEAGRDRFQRLFQAAPVASAIVSLSDRRIVDINEFACARYGLAREAMLGAPTSSFAYGVVPEDRETFYRVFAADGKVRSLVVRVRDEHGIVHPEAMSAEPIDYLGQACCLVTSQDISDLRVAAETRQALAEAQAANLAKNAFLSRISHELRTPLHAILGFSSVLRRDARSMLTDAHVQQLQHVERAGKHLLALVNDVLDLSRIESGNLQVAMAPTALSPVLRDAIAFNLPLAQRGGVTIDFDESACAAAIVLADRTRLRQVLVNVISNAAKFNRPGGTVKIQAVPGAGSWVISVVDDGLGMTNEQLSRLFEPFNRLGRDKEGIEGTGIGLTMARNLMSLMNGEITLSAVAGRGTTVRIVIPAGEAGEPAGSDWMALAPAQVTTPPECTVLYIEDNAVNALLVGDLLKPWPSIRLLVAENGAEGLRVAAAERPAAILLDMQLPDLSGLEVLRHLRAKGSACAFVPVIVLSASAMPEEVAAARAAGATDYWTKPLDFDRFACDLMACIRSGAARQPA